MHTKQSHKKHILKCIISITLDLNQHFNVCAMKRILLLAFIMLTISINAISQYNVTVAKDGSGNFTTVQAAIDAAPAGQTSPYKIFIKNGRYREKITIPNTKTFIYLIGESVANVILSWDDYSGKPNPAGGTFGTSNSASVTISGADCAAFNITFENTTGDAPQALAINVNADRCMLKNCRFLGGQDTILTNGNGNRQYFKNCYVDGVVDFIFGAAVAVFDSCIIYPKTRMDGLTGSYITAANTPAGQTYGYVFRNCTIPANRGITQYVLGRPWQNDGTTSPVSNTKVVFLNTTMGYVVKPQGWDVWNGSTNTSLITYAEYKSKRYDGSLVDVSQRVSWSQQLTDAQAAKYFINDSVFGNWNPCTVSAEMCAGEARPIAVSNFRCIKYPGALKDTVRWNISWPLAGIKYELYKGSSKNSFSKVYELTATTDSSINFDYFDTVPSPGNSFYYYLVASKAGLANHTTDTIQVSSIPTITVTGSPSSLLQGGSTPSAPVAYTVSGVNLLSGVTITAPPNFEISTDNGTTWNGSASPVTLNQTNTVLNNTVVQVRLNASTPGTYNNFITHTSTGADTVKLAVTGTAQTDPLLVSNALIQWPFNLSNSDSARDASISAASQTFNKLTVANGTGTGTILPAYGPTHGMTFGANGDGSWGTASGGPGGNLNRTYYVQFQVTAANNYSVKVDSLILTSSFYNTSSNTKLAAVYSLTGFSADSTDVTGGLSPTGTLLAPTANGAFLTPIVLTNQTGATTANYRLALNGSTGVTVNANQTLTIRLYYSCGSSSSNRYGKLKDVIIKGSASTTLPVKIASVSAAKKMSGVEVKWISESETNMDRYEVERSVNGSVFEKLTAVQASGIKAYAAFDANPSAVNFYRVKAISKDGSFIYSSTVRISLSSTVQPEVIIAPNPVKNKTVQLQLNNIKTGIYTIRIFNTAGIEVAAKSIHHNGNNSSINIPSNNLQSGIYVVKLYGTDEVVSKNIIVE